MNGEGTAVVLLSGGIDSSVLLRLVRRRTPCVHALCFNYGQRHVREIDCARYQAETVGVASFKVLNLDFLGDALRDASALIDGGVAVPSLAEVPQAGRDQPPTYVPNRNMMLLSIAVSIAEALGASEVHYGAQAQDEYGYWDCTPEFLEQMNQVLVLNRRQSITIQAPLIRHSKVDNLRLGLAAGVDFAHTWSCYRGQEKACGECPTCVERLNAFKELEMTDPLPYAQNNIRT